MRTWTNCIGDARANGESDVEGAVSVGEIGEELSSIFEDQQNPTNDCTDALVPPLLSVQARFRDLPYSSPSW